MVDTCSAQQPGKRITLLGHFGHDESFTTSCTQFFEFPLWHLENASPCPRLATFPVVVVVIELHH